RNHIFQQTFFGENKTIARNGDYTTAMEVSPINIFKLAGNAPIQFGQPQSAVTATPLSTNCPPVIRGIAHHLVTFSVANPTLNSGQKPGIFKVMSHVETSSSGFTFRSLVMVHGGT